MMRGTLGGTAAVLFCVTISSTARGSGVVLRSAEMAEGSGFNVRPQVGQPGGFYQPTMYTPAVPFPNDAFNYAGVGPGGLRVIVNKNASFLHLLHNSLWESWGARRFQVQFDLGEAESYTYTRSIANSDDGLASIVLQADGQLPITGLPLSGERSGVLPAGSYTFSGEIDFESFSYYDGRGQFITYGGWDVVLTVAPDPAALPALGVLMLFTLRRRRR